MQITPKQAAARLRKLCSLRPSLGVVLGTGFQHVVDRMEIEARLPYRRIPGFLPATVAGHAGEFIIGTLAGTPVAVLSGRVHYYEGHSMERVTFAVRTLAALGIRDLLLTNAVGGISRSLRPGDFMVVEDHINFMGANPLRGVSEPGLPRFVDMTEVYDADLRRFLFKAGRASGVRLKRGVYLAVSGPSYETPAEIRAFAHLGADVVGMSTVPEAIVARQCGIQVVALSCITNCAAGLGGDSVSHEEVLSTAAKVKTRAAALMEKFVGIYLQNQ